MEEFEIITSEFNDIINIITNAKETAIRKVNEELIKMYWEIGKKLSEKSKESGYGEHFIDKIAEMLKKSHPELKGFNRRGLYRMKQFYEIYSNDVIMSPLVTQLSWTNSIFHDSYKSIS